MKKFLCATGLSLLLLTSPAVFAADKIAVVDVMQVLQQMPQRQAVAKVLEGEFEARAKALQAEEKVAQSNMQKLQKEGLTLSATEKKKLEDAIIQFENKAKEFSQEYRRRESEEANKLLAKIEAAVKAIAEKEKYTLVIKAEAAFYVNSANDITAQVLKQVK